MRLLGIGDNTVDIYIDRGVEFPGGNAVNVAVQARRLGAEAGYLGCVGRDRYGELIEASLAAESVDITHLRRINGPNPWCRIRHHGGDRVFVGSSPGVRGCYLLSNDDSPYLASFDVVHTSINSDIDSELAFVRHRAALLSYDYSSKWSRPRVAASLAQVDIAFLSDPDSSDENCCARVAWALAAGVSRAVVVTRGSRGSCAGSRDGVWFETIRPAVVADSLGAGDAFIAAFLISFRRDGDLAKALAHGAENAARACTYEGGFGHGRAAHALPEAT